jgi:hypothetical protein
MVADVVVTGVAGRAEGTDISGVCFLRGPSGGLRLPKSEAFRLRTEGGVMVLGGAESRLMTRPGCERWAGTGFRVGPQARAQWLGICRQRQK